MTIFTINNANPINIGNITTSLQGCDFQHFNGIVHPTGSISNDRILPCNSIVKQLCGITLQSSSPAEFSPTDISGLVAWYDASVGVLDSSGSPADDGDNIQTWEDQAGSFDLLNITPTEQPTLEISGLNGHNIVHFDGSNNIATLVGTSILSDYPGTIFTVARADNDTDFDAIWWHGLTTATIPYIYAAFGGSVGGDPIRLQIQTAAGLNPADTTTPFIAGQFHYITALLTSTTSRTIFLDGSGSATSTLSRTITGHNNFCLGRLNDLTPGNVLSGDIAEVLIYDRALSPTEISDVENYLVERYAL